ncbi:hypothetical protein M422DRAFT_44520 [Sphaerobolus stellatus SS14]|nr:hypothetical protein M422DRAFT_44520 [Sphaerobolus stellatus SS14]
MPLPSWAKKIIFNGKANNSEGKDKPKPDWIGNAVRVAKLTAAVSELTPVTAPLKGAADLFLLLLEPLQEHKRNQEEFKSVTQSISATLKALYDEISDPAPGFEPSQAFSETSLELTRYLQMMSTELHAQVSLLGSSNLKRFVNTNQVCDILSIYAKKLNELRINFISHSWEHS